MLKWIREFRFDLKTSVILLVAALVGWALFAYANIHDFVPDEFTEPRQEAPGRQP